MSQASEDLLVRAKDALKSGDAAAALSLLRRASYENDSDYPYSAKAARFAAKLLSKSGELGLKKTKVALLSSTTTVFLEPLLKYFALLAGMEVELKCGEFGSWRNEIADAQSWLYEFKPNFVIINTHFRDFPLPPFCDAPKTFAEKSAASVTEFWDLLSSRLDAKIIQNDIDAPRFESGGRASALAENGRVRVLAETSRILRGAAAARGVQIAEFAALESRLGEKWADVRTWYHGRQHPAPAALPALAKEYSLLLKMHLGLSKKLLVCDLDNTLWGGVISEDGLDGIRLGAPDPRGEAFCDFQKYLVELKNRGVLLAVCSKNNIEDALLPFEKHSAMKLSKDDFACFKANWERKSDNIRAIAKELSLGLDSFVFIDDNPMEIEEVSAALPQVECLTAPKDAALLVETLDRRGFFDSTAVTADDIARNASYKANAARAELLAQSSNPADFLKKFEMRCVDSDVADNFDRCVQLINKTNQFNLTTLRMTDVELRELLAREGSICRCFSLSDKFGDSGIVGIVLAEKTGDANWNIVNFLMSCRVLGRGLEFYMVDSLVERLLGAGGENLSASFIPMKKNSQVADFFDKCGFVLQSSTPDGAKKYICSLQNFEPIQTFISAM